MMIGHALTTLLLTVSLSHEGHWLGAYPNTIHVEWVMPEHAVASVIRWQLGAGEVQLAEGQLTMDADGRAAALTITPPAVRVRTTLRWLYTIHTQDGQLLQHGELPIHVHPDDQLPAAGRRLVEPVIVLAGADAPLVIALREADIPHRRLNDVAAMTLQPPRVVLVAPGHLNEMPDQGKMLLRLAEHGAAVMVFEQQVEQFMGLHVRRRPMPDELTWRRNHALFRGMDDADRASWLAKRQDVWALQIGMDEPGMALSYWPGKVDDTARSMDVLMLTRTVGRGRVLFCQLPLGGFDSDPRTRQLLANALDDLATPPGSTPSPDPHPLPTKTKAMGEIPSTLSPLTGERMAR